MAVTDEISVGVVGCGRCALFGHLPALGTLGSLFRVTAVCDLEKSRRERVARDFPEVQHYRRLEDMIDDPDIDLVLITTPSIDHEASALACLNRGLWTVCETPVALSHDGALVLRGASIKEGGKLIAATPALFSNEFRLASQSRVRHRIGDLYDIRIRQGTYLRRDDWQATAKRGGGATHYAAQEPVLQALSLLKAPPVQMWSEMKKIVALGDAEDYVRLMLRTAEGVTADIEANSAVVKMEEPAITLRGTRGSFSVMQGASVGHFCVIDPSQRFRNHRSSVALPPLEMPAENIQLLETVAQLANPMPAYEAFWRAVHETVRNEKPFPVDFDLVVELARYIGIVRKSSPIAI